MIPAPAADFFIGTYTSEAGSRGIYRAALNSETGRLSAPILAGAATSPSFLARSPDGKMLYAAIEAGDGAAAAFRVEADGKLTRLNQKPTGGKGSCHVSLDRAGGCVFVADYESGSVAVFKVGADGSIGERAASIAFEGSGPDADRQKTPHGHSVSASPDNRFVYACDLGTDKVRIFKLDAGAGKLTPADPPFAMVPGGAGPRHLAFGANGAFAYVANEMGRSVCVFRRNAGTGALTLAQTLSLGAPSKHVSLAEIALHPNGRWLYVSSRGDDAITVLAVAPDGGLAPVETASGGVRGPRSFAIEPGGRWLVVAGQNDDRIVSVPLDPATGRLGPVADEKRVGAPVCVIFTD